MDLPEKMHKRKSVARLQLFTNSLQQLLYITPTDLQKSPKKDRLAEAHQNQ